MSPDPRELHPDRRHRVAQPVVDTCLERKMATDKRLDPPCPIDTALRRPMIEDCGFDVGDTKVDPIAGAVRSEEHTSELQSLMRISYAVFCLKKKKKIINRISKPNNMQKRQNTTIKAIITNITIILHIITLHKILYNI